MATIEHEKWGRVEGVRRSDNEECGDSPSWWKEDEKCLTEYFSEKGWREVKEEKWVDVTRECVIEKNGEIIHKYRSPTGHIYDVTVAPGLGYRTLFVPRHHLPEDVYEQWGDIEFMPGETTKQAFTRFLKQFSEPVIIVQRREE